MAEWETFVLPAPIYRCAVGCVQGWSGNTELSHNLVWYNGKGDFFTGSIGDVDDDGNPYEEDRILPGFKCRLCVAWFRKGGCDDSYFGPTLAEELQRRHSQDDERI